MAVSHYKSQRDAHGSFQRIVFFGLLLLECTLGLPVQPPDVPVARAVYSPLITAPAAGAVFAVGASTIVTWDPAGIPADSLHTHKGTLMLGYTEEGDSNEHLDVDTLLATDIDLRAGAKRITFPDHLPTRTTYIIVLLGDSGNKSPPFTITACASG